MNESTAGTVGAPNILLILTDDAGSGNPGTFGGPIRTPALDRLAAGGLNYTPPAPPTTTATLTAAAAPAAHHHDVSAVLR